MKVQYSMCYNAEGSEFELCVAEAVPVADNADT